MGVLKQIREDAAFLRNLIAGLRSDCTVVTQNGDRLTGEALENALASARKENLTELKRLELILESGWIYRGYSLSNYVIHGHAGLPKVQQ